LNKVIHTTIITKKAHLTGCLFLFFSLLTFSGLAQQWVFDERTQQAYDLVLNLQTEDAFLRIPEPTTVQEHYVIALAEALELLISEDRTKFAEYEDHFKKRVNSKIKSSNADYQFLRAEMHLQWAFVYLKFGQEINAASQLQDAYHIAEACQQQSPDYRAIDKTAGLLEIIIGSVPEKYNWVLSLLGMQGSIEDGVNKLDGLRKSTNNPFAFESDLLYSLVYGFVLEKPEIGLESLEKILQKKPDNRMALFTASALAIKTSQNEKALELLNALSERKEGFPIFYAEYLKGEVYLHKGDYIDALSNYRWFVKHYKGQNNLKDAYYKMGLCYWLNGNANDALHVFRDAKTFGTEASEADKSASRSLTSIEPPHVELTKIRFAIDGGYYTEARKMLLALNPKVLPEKRDQVDYYYRSSRLEHKTNKLAEAKVLYLQTVEMAGNENWYYAPNSCLQVGYILMSENKPEEAKRFFQKALSYKKHEYKNSIDSKARSALNRLR
jgi:tetratricopeptide (TPR) repeat protein